MSKRFPRIRQKGPVGSATSTIVSARTRKDVHPTLAVDDKPSLILDCLKTTRCAMDWRMIQHWVMANRKVALTQGEVVHHARKLRVKGVIENPNEATTRQWQFPKASPSC